MARDLENVMPFPAIYEGRDLLHNLYPTPGKTGLRYGFLSKGEDLEALIAADTAMLEQLGVTHAQVADAIRKLFTEESTTDTLETLVLPQKFIHSPPCPWGDYSTTSPFASPVPVVTQITVLNRDKIDEALDEIEKIVESSSLEQSLEQLADLVRRDLIMLFSDLHPHLIEAHHFFEGQGNPYRVDPERAIRYLRIQPTAK